MIPTRFVSRKLFCIGSSNVIICNKFHFVIKSIIFLYFLLKKIHTFAIFFISFSWLRGAYGITGPNEIIGHTHFYVTVEKDKKKCEMLEDIRAAFEVEPEEYFELRREPKKPEKFKFLVKPSPGGGIVLKEKENEQNPLRVQNDPVDEESSEASGTLTMFYFDDGKHYALTCYHVGIQTEEQQFDHVFNRDNLLALRKSVQWAKEFAPQYSYRKSESQVDNTDENINIVGPINLGRFCDGFFDSDSDIMSIEVDEDVGVDCKLAKIDAPNWSAIWKELHERLKRRRRRGDVKVSKLGYSSAVTDGYIDDINYTYKYKDELLFKNAVAVKSDSNQSFLKPGDSGALVHFMDSKNKPQAFAYGVCEVAEEDDSDVDFRNEGEGPEMAPPLFICLRLNTGLKSLEKFGDSLEKFKGCFRKCGRN